MLEAYLLMGGLWLPSLTWLALQHKLREGRSLGGALARWGCRLGLTWGA